MGIENIIERVLSDARRKTAQILDESNSEAARVLEEAKKKAELAKSLIIASAETKGDEEKQRILTFGRLEARNALLAEKHKMIDLVFARAHERVLSLPDKEYVKLINSLLINSAETGEGEIIFSPQDKGRITEELIERVNAALKAKGRQGNLKVSKEQRNIKGGFILKWDGIEINNSFEVLLQQLREELEFTIMEMLS